jgi:hypothetical protein
MSKRDISSHFLRSLADAIDALSEQEFRTLLATAGLRRLVQAAGRSDSRTKANRENLIIEAQALLSRLHEMPSREQARSYLTSDTPSRNVLIHAAKLRDMHVAKSDTVSVLIEKLVSNVVGAKLDSYAIRNG